MRFNKTQHETVNVIGGSTLGWETGQKRSRECQVGQMCQGRVLPGEEGGHFRRSAAQHSLRGDAAQCRLGKIGKDRRGQKRQEPDGEPRVAAVALPSLRGPG